MRFSGGDDLVASSKRAGGTDPGGVRRLASSEDQGAAQVDVEDRLKATEGDPGADHQRHPVELLVREVLLGLGEPRVVEAEMVERELLGILNGDAGGLG